MYFFELEAPVKVDILGTTYTISCNEELENYDGLVDKSTREIKICKTLLGKSKDGEVADKRQHFRKVLRHEIIHAFQNESGLQECSNWDIEQMTDYFAIQFPKMEYVFKKLGIEK